MVRNRNSLNPGHPVGQGLIRNSNLGPSEVKEWHLIEIGFIPMGKMDFLRPRASLVFMQGWVGDNPMADVHSRTLLCLVCGYL